MCTTCIKIRIMIYFCESSNYILAHDNRIYIFMSVFTYIIIIFVVEICNSINLLNNNLYAAHLCDIIQRCTTGFWKSKDSTTGFWKSKDSTTGFWKSKDSTTGFWKSKDSTTGFWKRKDSTTGFLKSKDSTTGFWKSKDSTTGFWKS